MGSSADITEIKACIQDVTDSIRALERLGYIESYSIPVQAPRMDADARVDMITDYSLSQHVPTIIVLQRSESRTELNVVDRVGNRKYWELFVREYLETP